MNLFKKAIDKNKDIVIKECENGKELISIKGNLSSAFTNALNEVYAKSPRTKNLTAEEREKQQISEPPQDPIKSGDTILNTPAYECHTEEQRKSLYQKIYELEPFTLKTIQKFYTDNVIKKEIPDIKSRINVFCLCNKNSLAWDGYQLTPEEVLADVVLKFSNMLVLDSTEADKRLIKITYGDDNLSNRFWLLNEDTFNKNGYEEEWFNLSDGDDVCLSYSRYAANSLTIGI